MIGRLPGRDDRRSAVGTARVREDAWDRGHLADLPLEVGVGQRDLLDRPVDWHAIEQRVVPGMRGECHALGGEAPQGVPIEHGRR